MVSAIVFDFDGVIADSEPLHLAAFQQVLSPLGVTLTRHEYYTHYLGYDDVSMIRKLAEAHNWTVDERQIETIVAEKGRVFDAAMETADVLYPGAADCITRLAA